jgi:hypothetical protein
MDIRIAIASHDRHRRRSSARNTSLTAPKGGLPGPQCRAPQGKRQGHQPVRFERASTNSNA